MNIEAAKKKPHEEEMFELFKQRLWSTVGTLCWMVIIVRHFFLDLEYLCFLTNTKVSILPKDGLYSITNLSYIIYINECI